MYIYCIYTVYVYIYVYNNILHKLLQQNIFQLRLFSIEATFISKLGK